MALNGPASSLPLNAARWDVAANEPLEPRDLTPDEAAALVNAYRVLAEALDGNKE